MAKRPSIQFYPGDWRKDPTVNCLSLAARGLWLEMLLLMNEAPRRGVLDMPVEGLARSAGGSVAEVRKLIAEMDRAGTFGRVNGSIVNRRMLREQGISVARALAGQNGAAKRWQNDSKQDGKTTQVATDLPCGLPFPARVNAEAEAEDEELRKAFKSFAELWQKPCDCCGLEFPFRSAQLGAQVWLSLVDSGGITAVQIPEITAGLERYRASQDWHKERGKYVPSVPAFLGWSKDGRPAAPRWNDRPAPFATQSGY